MISRSELVGEVIEKMLPQVKLGLIVRRVPEIDVVHVMNRLIMSTEREFYVAVIGYPLPPNIPNLVCTDTVEQAVAWRSDPSFAGKVIVFIDAVEAAKMTSLSDFDVITSREIARQLVTKAARDLSLNEPQRKFWEVLRNEADRFPLSLIEDFVNAIETKNTENPIPGELWRLGLLPDPQILDPNKNTRERLQRNRELLSEMRQLSENSRRRMSSVLKRARDEERVRLSTAFRDLMDFFRRGLNSVLSNLDVPTVETLVKAGRRLPGGAPIHRNDGTTEPSQEPEIWRSKELNTSVTDLLLNYDESAQSSLTELVDGIKQKYEAQDFDEPIVWPSQQGARIMLDYPESDLRSFICKVCSKDHWGGHSNAQRKT